MAKAVGGRCVSDRKVSPDAVRFGGVTIQEVIDRRLAAMDLSASIMCMENHMPMLVFLLNGEDSIINAARGKSGGTRVTV